MYGITNYNSELTEFSTIDELIEHVLEQGIDPSKWLYINGEQTGETVFEPELLKNIEEHDKKEEAKQ